MGYRGQMIQTQKVPLCVAAGHGSSTFLLPCVAFPQRAETSNVFTGTKNLARCLLVAPSKGGLRGQQLLTLDICLEWLSCRQVRVVPWGFWEWGYGVGF